MLFEVFEEGDVFFGVVEEGEGFAFYEPGKAEEGEEYDFDHHGHVAGGVEQFYEHENDLEGDHGPAAETIDGVAHTFARSHVATRFGEEADAVDGQQEEEQCGKNGVEDVGNLHGELEETDGLSGGYPADLAGE